jgi:Terminase large subunit, T4likevirus-type, N-terminal
MINVWDLRPIQALVAAEFFKKRRMMLMLPRQEGKTELGCRFLHQLLNNDMETRQGLFLSKSKASIKKMTREKFKRIFEDEKFQVNTEMIINRSNSYSSIFMESVDKRPDKIRGGTYNLINWAEVAFSEFDHGVTVHDIHHKIVGPTLRATNGMAFFESTPNGNNGWKEMWEDTKAYPEYTRLRFSLSQLVAMGLREQSEYETLKATMPDLEFRQEYECEWVSFIGRAYPEFMPHHVWAEMPPPQHWQRVFFAVDWGYNPSATCVLFGYVLNNRICVFDEIYHREKTLDEIQKLIKEKFVIWNLRQVAGVADHDPRSNKELELQGILVSNVDKTNVYGNRLEVKTLLKNNMLYIHPRCEYAIKDMERAQWDSKREGEIDYKNCSYGHYDGEAALRYLVRGFKHNEADAPAVLKAGDHASKLEALKRGNLTRNP